MTHYQSDNHGFPLGYEQGEDWDYNSAFQTLEEMVVVRDTDANRTNYTPHTDAIYIATDNGAIYLGDGASWNALGEIDDLSAYATENWVDDNYAATDHSHSGYLSESDTASIDNSWTFEAGLDIWEGYTLTLGDIDHVAHFGIPSSGGPALLELASATGFEIDDSAGNTIFSLDESTGQTQVSRSGTLENAASETWVDNNYNDYTDSDAQSAINNDSDHGVTASHDYLEPTDVDSSNWDDYEIQKDGSDTTGVINFKTS